jgi:RNA polymerase primary sigma factor
VIYTGRGHPNVQTLRFPVNPYPSPLSSKEQVELCLKAQSGDKSARDRLILASMRFVVTRARFFVKRTPGADIDDMSNEGVAGLIKAIEKFDASKGVRFITYAVRWIDVSIRNSIFTVRDIKVSELRRREYLVRYRENCELGLDHEAALNAVASSHRAKVETVAHVIQALTRGPPLSLDGEGFSNLPSPPLDVDGLLDRQAHQRRIKRILSEVRRELNPKEVSILDKRLLSDGEEATLSELGALCGVTRQRIKQLETRLISRLRSALADTHNEPTVGPKQKVARKPKAPVGPKQKVARKPKAPVSRPKAQAIQPLAATSPPPNQGPEWLILELKDKAEGEDPDVIRDAICRRIKDAEVFIPASVTTIQGERIVRYFMEGYAFIKRTRDDTIYRRLIDSTYVEALACAGGKFSTIGDKEIDRLRGQVSQDDSDHKPEVDVGDLVVITAGTYETIEATVERKPGEGDDDMVPVFIKLRSLERSVMVPRGCLRPVELPNPLQTWGRTVVEKTVINTLCRRFRQKGSQWAIQLKDQSPGFVCKYGR